MAEENSEQPIIIKKIKKGGGGHGGAWKVAYADFVTAMMAFFLLLWLLNVTTAEQKDAISNYFDPTHPKVSDSKSGAGGVLGGLSMSPKGAMTTNQQPVIQTRQTMKLTSQKLSAEEKKARAKEKAKEKKRSEERREFRKLQNKIMESIKGSPQLKALEKHLKIDMTPEGLRIQIIDQDGEPMFPSGSARMFQKTQELLATITKIITSLPNEVSVRGHTDAVPYTSRGNNYSNWELSTDRANSSRRVMLDNGFPKQRFSDVMGKADTDLYVKDDPNNAQNRRISIILLREEITNPDIYDDIEGEISNEEEYEEDTVPVGTFQKTPGKIQFP